MHDIITLWASTRRGGRSLAEIARSEIGPVAGTTAVIAVLFILIIALAGLGLAVVNALAESAWGIFTIGATIPIAIFMGFYMFVWRKGQIQEATIIGVTLMFLGVIFGKNVAESSIGHWFVLTPHQITIALGLYGLAAATLPVWMLLTPRDYLSTYMKIGTILFLRHRRGPREPARSRRRRSRSSSAAADRSSPARCSRSCSSRSRAAPSPGSTR